MNKILIVIMLFLCFEVFSEEQENNSGLKIATGVGYNVDPLISNANIKIVDFELYVKSFLLDIELNYYNPYNPLSGKSETRYGIFSLNTGLGFLTFMPASPSFEIGLGGTVVTELYFPFKTLNTPSNYDFNKKILVGLSFNIPSIKYKFNITENYGVMFSISSFFKFIVYGKNEKDTIIPFNIGSSASFMFIYTM